MDALPDRQGHQENKGATETKDCPAWMDLRVYREISRLSQRILMETVVFAPQDLEDLLDLVVHLEIRGLKVIQAGLAQLVDLVVEVIQASPADKATKALQVNLAVLGPPASPAAMVVGVLLDLRDQLGREDPRDHVDNLDALATVDHQARPGHKGLLVAPAKQDKLGTMEIQVARENQEKMPIIVPALDVNHLPFLLIKRN